MLKPVLDYPLDAVPEPGTMVPVCAGVHWLRMPLPMALNHINLWVLDDGQSWDLVDSGVDTSETRRHWETLFGTSLETGRLNRIIITHMHPDHVGLAGWLAETTGAPMLMSRTDYLMCRMLCADPKGQPPQVALDFYRQAGFDDDLLANYTKRFGEFGSVVSPLPQSFQRMSGGQVLRSGGRDWRLIEGRGHAPEHICLYCEADDLFIAGDQLLPTISSNVSVWPTEPTADPLAEWLESCRFLGEIISNDTLVLPSHGQPFRGGATRLQWLLDHHAEQLETVLHTCTTPATVRDVIAAMFIRKLRGSDLVMAAGEAIAHLNYLVNRNELAVDQSATVTRYSRL